MINIKKILLLFLVIILCLNPIQSTQKQAEELKQKACSGLGENSIVSEEQRKSANENLKQIKEIYRPSGNNLLEKDVLNRRDEENNDRYMDYMYATFFSILIYLILAILSCIGCFGYIIFSQYEPCCPCIPGCAEKYDSVFPVCKNLCKCCKTNQCMYLEVEQKQKYTGIYLYWAVVGLCISLFGLIIICIIGIINSEDMYESFKTISCASITTIYDFAYGDIGWVGIEQLGQKVLNLLSDLDPFLASIAINFGGLSWINTGLEDLSDKIGKLSQQQESGVSYTYLNNPLGSGVSFTLDSSNNYLNDYTSDNLQEEQPSTFFGNNLSPFYYIFSTDQLEDDFNSSITDIANKMSKLEVAGKQISDQGPLFKTKVDKGQENLKKYLVQLDKFIVDLDENFSFVDSYASQLGSFINYIYYFFLFCSLLILVPLGIMALKHFYVLRYIFHFCWVFFSICQILTFIMVGIFMVVSIFGMEFCEIFNKFLNDPVEFNKYPDIIPLEITTRAQICKTELGGNGQIIQSFKVYEQLNQIRKLELHLQTFINDMNDIDTGVLNDFSDQIDVILDNMILMRDQNYLEVDNNKLLEHFNLDMALSQLNTEACVVSNTQAWVKNKQECTGGTLVTNLQDNLNGKCFWIGGSSLSSDTQGYFTKNQYDSEDIYSACPTAKDKLQNLLIWRDDKINLFDVKYQETKDVQDSFGAYLSNIDTFFSNMQTFSTDFQHIFTQVTDEKVGIFADINCLFLGQNLDLIYDAVCLSLISNIYDLGFILQIFGFFMLSTSYFLFMTAKKFAWNTHVHDIVEQKSKGNKYQQSVKEQPDKLQNEEEEEKKLKQNDLSQIKDQENKQEIKEDNINKGNQQNIEMVSKQDRKQKINDKQTQQKQGDNNVIINLEEGNNNQQKQQKQQKSSKNNQGLKSNELDIVINLEEDKDK